ncbi:MAG: YlxR family protein [Gaiellales bacterium]
MRRSRPPRAGGKGRGGDGVAAAQPVRQCAGCGESRPQRELVRLTARDGILVVDRERRLGGRGAYICPSADCAERARRRGALPRRLRGEVTVPADLAAHIRVVEELS